MSVQIIYDSKYLEHDTGLHSDQDNLSFLCDLGILCRDSDSEFIAQTSSRLLERLAHQDLLGRAKFRAHQAAHDGSSQFAATDKTEPILQVACL